MASTRTHKGGKTTMRDVASAAGVSTAAVSKVLHGSNSTIGVSEVRAKEIRAVAERLNYVPNLLARGLRQGRTGDIGLVFEDFRGLAAGPRYDALVFEGIAEVLFQRGLRLTILPEMRSPEAISHLHDGRLDGAIWCRLDRGTLDFPLGDVKIPIVAMNAAHAFAAGAQAIVACDNEGGAARVARHFVELGHRRIA
ncbi:LacI family transcriptional regulator, partial [bacterium]